MERVQKLRSFLEQYYKEHGQNLQFHGWHHIVFVTDKATALAKEVGADVEIVATAALVHDLNYIVQTFTRAEVGQELRQKILREHDYNSDEVVHIEEIIVTSDLRRRDENISLDAQVLSDADTLFKCIPVGAALFTSNYLKESGTSLEKMAQSIIGVQGPLIDKGIYFYTAPYQERYLEWAKHNFKTWQLIADSLRDNDIRSVVEYNGIKL